MLVLFIIVCLAAIIGAIVSSNTYNNRMFAISAIALIVSTILCIGAFNIITVSAIVGEIYWLRFVYNRKYDELNDSRTDLLIESSFHAAVPFFTSFVSLFIVAHVFVANSTAIDCVREFFLLRLN